MGFQAPESLSEQIAQHLGQRIIRGDLAPGERIQEVKVAGELSVSRGSVREALLILERRHLVRIFPRRGAAVAVLTEHGVNGLYDVYIPLLELLADKAVANVKPDDLAAFTRQIDALEKKSARGHGGPDQLVEDGFELMRLCYGLVDNPYLAETLDNFRPAVSRTYHLAMQVYREEMERSRQFFRNLLTQAREGDREGVKAVIRDYAEGQRKLVLRALTTTI